MASPWQLRQAARCLRRGGLVAHPTEAVFGLACNPFDPIAVLRLLRLKRRSPDKGLILVAAEAEALRPFLLWSDLPETVQASWPGPHTWLLPAAPTLPPWISGGRPLVAVRVTAHPLTAALCRAFGGALVSTSANRTGRPPARNALQVRLHCPGADRVLAGATGGLARPTPIRNALTGEILRP